MPRISPELIFQAARRSKYLPFLIRACRTLESASQELAWIKNELPREEWIDAVIKRSSLVPLQYILKSQPFGEIDIKCRKNVLIPRWETEEWCLKLIDILRKKSNLSVLDVCTGTGCIPLLIGYNLKESKLKAIDISPDCISLAKENKEINRISNVDFEIGDVFQENLIQINNSHYDIITSNPPYIPLDDYKSKEMEKSVKMYEPKLALVGSLEFYKALIENIVFPSQAKGFIFELGYESQYTYTKSLLNGEWDTKLIFDSNDKPRCVVGWKVSSEFECLSTI